MNRYLKQYRLFSSDDTSTDLIEVFDWGDLNGVLKDFDFPETGSVDCWVDGVGIKVSGVDVGVVDIPEEEQTGETNALFKVCSPVEGCNGCILFRRERSIRTSNQNEDEIMTNSRQKLDQVNNWRTTYWQYGESKVQTNTYNCLGSSVTIWITQSSSGWEKINIPTWKAHILS